MMPSAGGFVLLCPALVSPKPALTGPFSSACPRMEDMPTGNPKDTKLARVTKLQHQPETHWSFIMQL